MSSQSLPHVDRTASEPRQNALYTVRISKISQVNPTIRLLQLSLPEEAPFHFLPGQWLDVHIPSIPQAGGFTITSTPGDTLPQRPASNTNASAGESPKGDSQPGYLELAVQHSPHNPPAAYLWRPPSSILGSELQVRVGGSFTWPPAPIKEVWKIKRAVFIAGGVGINPLISMLSHMRETNSMPESVQVLYSARAPDEDSSIAEVLFYTRLSGITAASERRMELRMFLTGGGDSMENELIGNDDGTRIGTFYRRIMREDLVSAVGRGDRTGTVCYVCGPAGMTDEFVEVLRELEGMEERRVLCEKWW